jgi:hypothetical protein
MSRRGLGGAKAECGRRMASAADTPLTEKVEALLVVGCREESRIKVCALEPDIGRGETGK